MSQRNPGSNRPSQDRQNSRRESGSGRKQSALSRIAQQKRERGREQRSSRSEISPRPQLADPDDVFDFDTGNHDPRPLFDRHPAIVTYVSIMAMTALLLMTGLRFGVIRPFFIFTLAAGLAIFLRVWSLPILLFAVQLELLIREPFSADSSSNPFGEIMFAAGLIMLLVATARYVILTASPLPYDCSMFQSLKRIATGNNGDDQGHKSRSTNLYSPTELSTGLIRVTLSVALAAWWLWYVPFDPDAVDYAWLVPTGLRAILLGSLALGVICLANVLISAYAWQGISSGQAKAYLRSVATRWTFKEIRATIRRQVKARLKGRKR